MEVKRRIVVRFAIGLTLAITVLGLSQLQPRGCSLARRTWWQNIGKSVPESGFYRWDDQTIRENIGDIFIWNEPHL